jgi:nitric oxide reductase large subunit
VNTITVFSVVEAIILAMSVGLLCWLAAKVVGLAELVSMHGTQVIDIQQRVGKLETAALLAATVPGKLDTITAHIEALKEGQLRIENSLSKKNAQ